MIQIYLPPNFKWSFLADGPTQDFLSSLLVTIGMTWRAYYWEIRANTANCIATCIYVFFSTPPQIYQI